MKINFGQWGTDEAAMLAFRACVRDAVIWEQQRTDSGDMERAATRDYSGSWLAILNAEKNGAAGFSIYVPLGPGVFEQHVGLCGDWRGDIAKEAMMQVTRSMFVETPAMQIICPCPDFNPSIERLATLCKAQFLYRREQFDRRDGEAFGASYMGKGFINWAFENACEFGELHNLLFSGLAEGWEPSQRQMTGLAVTLALKGQAEKAALIFNLWAELFLAEPMRVCWHSGNSAVLEISSHRIHIVEGKILKSIKQPCP